jgi:hypothetical protein
VYANLTVTIYQVLGVSFFRVWGAIYSAFTILLWVVIFYRTVVLVPHGRIFDAPCLEDVDTGGDPSIFQRSGGERGERSPVSKEIAEGGS